MIERTTILKKKILNNIYVNNHKTCIVNCLLFFRDHYILTIDSFINIVSIKCIEL